MDNVIYGYRSEHGLRVFKVTVLELQERKEGRVPNACARRGTGGWLPGRSVGNLDEEGQAGSPVRCTAERPACLFISKQRGGGGRAAIALAT